MANVQANFGFKHVGSINGATPNFQYSTYFIQKSTASAIGYGDPVIRTNATSAYIVQASPSAASTNPIVGVFFGCFYIPTSGIPQWSPSWPGGAIANQDAIAYVCDDPNATFVAATLQTSLGTGDIGKVINFSSGTASAIGGQFSTATLDQSTATSAGGTAISPLPFRVVGIYGQAAGGVGGLPTNYGGVGNGTDPTTNFDWAVVSFNWQINRSGVGF